MSSRRVLIGGFYGAVNLGDEMILSVFVRWLREANAEPVVISLNPGYTRQSLGVQAVDFNDLSDIADAAATADLFVLGGGGLFGDRYQLDVSSLYHFPAATVSQYAQFALMAGQYGVPIAALAQGVGPLRSAPARDIVSDLFSRAAYVSVRDDGSAALLREIGVGRDVIVAPDPVWCHPLPATDWTIGERFPALRGKRVIAAIVREWPFGGSWEGSLAQAMRDALEPGDAVIWIAFQRQVTGGVPVLTDEATIGRLILAIGPDITHVRWHDATLDDVARLFQQPILGVIAMRLHALILALKAGAPALALEYDDKMRFAGEAAGLPAASRMPLEAIATRAPAALKALETNPSRAWMNTIERLAQQALEHRNLLTRAIADSGAAKGQRRWRSSGFDWLGSWRQHDKAAAAREIAALSRRLEDATAERDRLRSELAKTSERAIALEASIASVTSSLSEGRERIARLEEALNAQTYAARVAENRYQGAITSRSWRVTKPLRAAGDAARALRRVTRRTVETFRDGGVEAVHRKTMLKVRGAQSRHFVSDARVEEYEQILARYPDRPIVAFRPLVDWDLPLFQRPHHIARELARQGFLYFFCTPNAARDAIFGFREIEPGLVLTDQFLLLADHPSKKTWHIYSTDSICDVEFVESRFARGDSVAYEYIDELHQDISGNPIPPAVRRRHDSFLADERIALVTSADKLAAHARRARRRNHVFVTNGVDIDHFSLRRGQHPVPPDIEPVVARGKPIIGYFGALAKWFDYELVIALARARADLEILLIGWNYDGSMVAYDWTSVANVTVAGPVRYEQLPRYACWFDVCTIPFQLNEITASTSPIKLFEYMAMRRPIVTTDMPECRKYRSALIGRDHAHFIERVGEALGKRDDLQYLATLEREARRNSWVGKAREIGALLRIAEDYTSRRLDDVQQSIAAYYRQDDPTTFPAYERAYRAEERYYWFPVLRWIDDLRGITSVADIGGAYGTLLLYAKRALGVGRTLLVDAVRYASASMLRSEKIEQVIRDFEREDATDLGRFDLVLFTETLEHLNFHPLPTLLKLRDRVAPGGHVVVTTPDAEEWGRVTTFYPSLDAIPPYAGQRTAWIDAHVWQYTKSEVDALVDDAGFDTADFAFARGVAGRHLCYLLRPRD